MTPPRWSHVRHPDGRDTRIYDKVHIGCGTGYEYKPVWDDSLDFYFPTGSMKTARVIIFEGDEDTTESKLLLWSPNSLKRFPYFPGRRVPGSLKTPPHPFCDGHLGPFDYSRSPQYFDGEYPFLPFVRRCEHGRFPDAEEECVPVWAIWESLKERGTQKGCVLRAYWIALRRRVQQLRSDGAKLLKEPSCRVWNGFIESYPIHPYPSDLEKEPGPCCFQDLVRSLAALQRNIRQLAAWVRMGDALTKRHFRHDLSVAKASFGTTQEDLMGVWVNGLPESMVAWYAECGVPLFVVHEIQGDKDRPDNYPTLTKVDHPLEGSDLIGAPVLEKWLSLAQGKLVARYWDVGVNTKAAIRKDMLSRWRSAPTASSFNFPGDSWFAAPASSSINQIIFPSFVELPEAASEWKGLSMGSVHGVSYLIPPPVRGSNQGRWEHFAQDQTLDGISTFFLVGKRNQSLCSGLNYLFYDRACRRILHCDGPLPIPTPVVHDTSIYGFPCPKVHFYQDNTLTKKLHSSFWLYTTMDALRSDVGKCAPLPSLERVSHLLSKNQGDNAPQSDTREWTTEPTPVIVPIPPLEEESPPVEVQTVQTVAAMSPPMSTPLYPTPPSGQGNDQEETSIAEVRDTPSIVEVQDTPAIVEVQEPPPIVEVHEPPPIVEVQDISSIVEVQDTSSIVEVQDTPSIVEVQDTSLIAEAVPQSVTSAIDTPFTLSSLSVNLPTEAPDEEIVDFDLTDGESDPEPDNIDVAMADVENAGITDVEMADMEDPTPPAGSECKIKVMNNSAPPTPSTVSSLPLGKSSESSGASIDSRKRYLVDRIGDKKLVKRRRIVNATPYRPPPFRMTPSRLPNAPPIYSHITPYLIVNGIGRHTIEDLRAWLDLSVSPLRVTVVIKIRSRVGDGLFVIKFYDKEDAISFKCCYNLWTSLEGDTWAIDYVSHQDVLQIPQERIIDQWHLRRGGHLNPLLDRDDAPQPSRSSWSPCHLGARKRRGGRARREVQELEGKPS